VRHSTNGANVGRKPNEVKNGNVEWPDYLKERSQKQVPQAEALFRTQLFRTFSWTKTHAEAKTYEPIATRMTCRAAQPQYSLLCAAPPAAASPLLTPLLAPLTFSRTQWQVHERVVAAEEVGQRQVHHGTRPACAGASAPAERSQHHVPLQAGLFWTLPVEVGQEKQAPTARARRTRARPPHRAHAAHAHAASQAANCRAGSATPTP